MESSEGALVKEAVKTSNGPLLIFGQGPVIDRVTRVIPQEGLNTSGDEDVNFWSENLVKAASELYKRGQIPQIIVMGGKTGGKQFSSEAELIKQRLFKAGIPENIIETEENSPDTIANLINMINMKDTQGTQDKEKYQILGSPYHISRIQILMQLFKIPFNHVFSSDEVLRFVARNNTDDSSLWDTKLLTEIETRLDPDSNLYYRDKQGMEKRNYADRLIHDDLWTRELLEYPESWLGRVADIKNPDKRSEILAGAEKLWPGILQSKFGINRELDSPEEIQLKLTRIQKNPLSQETVQQWIEENKTIGWPKNVEARLNTLIQERHQK
ncbi:MAG: YdcF family protein [Candidatus Daviesbacteria bacterium]|nr:YdcF family protein [Candidatus Daviesbacteria bacterium]